MIVESHDAQTRESLQSLQGKLVREVERAGGVAGNVSLLRCLGWEESTYWTVRDQLVDAGQLELGRGRGGSVRIVQSEVTLDAAENVKGEVPTIPEDELYEPIAEVLTREWVRDNRFRQSRVEITARQGKRDTGGKWSRPDITVVGMTTYMYVPGRHLDVVTFEVKPADTIDVAAVYEALAHRRAATRAYVVAHVPQEKKSTTKATLEQVCDEAKRQGVGVIVIEAPTDYGTWDLRVDAARFEPAPEKLNDFVAAQLSDRIKQDIVEWFKY